MSKLNSKQLSMLVGMLLSNSSPEEGLKWAEKGEGALSLVMINLPPSLADRLRETDEGLVEACEKCPERPTCNHDKYLRVGDLTNELMTRCVIRGFDAFLNDLKLNQNLPLTADFGR